MQKKFLSEQIKRHPSFGWLDEATGCFWFTDAPGSTPIVRAVRKIQAVSRTVSIQDLMVAISRSGTRNLSASMLVRMCAQIPEISVIGEQIVFGSPGTRESLSKAEQLLTDIVAEGRLTVRSLEFVRRCETAGISRATAWRFLRTSPIVLRSGQPGLYRLTGNTHW